MTMKKLGWRSALLALAAITLAAIVPSTRAAAQDDQDDPPSRVARLGYMEGSVSFEPAGENDWVGAVDNRPLTIGDKIWADRDSRAELQLGSAAIRLSQNTGISFLNLDNRTVQLQLSSGAINVRVRRLDRDEAFEVDTPNLAFSLDQPGSYRVEASDDGTYTVVTIREGDGEATGNGQTYRIHAGQRATFSGTQSLDADVEQVGDRDQFDSWAYNRDQRWEHSRSAHYVSPDVVGYDDLDDNGDWRDEGNYGHVWFPHVAVGWAPYREGHWAWIDPWGYTWVDDAPWGYACFHYGRWAVVGGRWGWIAGPMEVHAVYAPALVVFVGGGGVAFGGNIAWFPLGPREVFVPSYHVSRAYVERVNISNTTVNTTTVTNVYNTTIVNNNTNITNVTYVNRNVQGAVTAVPQRAFASAQPVAKAAVAVNAEQLRAAPVSARVSVVPTREAVLGAKAATANRVTAPPPAVMNRQVIAKAAPPPPPPSFSARQQAMAAHPGQPLPKREMASLRPATAAAAQPAVKVAPPGKPATPTTGHPANPPANQPNAARPGQPAPGAPPANQPGNRPANQPAPNERPGAAAQPNNRPQPNQPENRPPAAQPNRPAQPENRPPAAQPNRPAQPENRPPAAEPNRPTQPENRPPAAQPNRPTQPENRPPAAEPNRPTQPENRPPATQPNRPAQPESRPPAAEPNRPTQPENRPPAAQPNRPTQPENRPPAAEPNRPEPNRNEPNRNEAQPRPNNPPAAQKPAPPPQKQQQKPQTPEEKKKQEEKKPPGE
jgi:hypothetical protein